MNTAQATTEAEIRAQVDSWLHAVLAMDIEAIVSHYASDIPAFDAVSQLQFKGVDAYRRHWQACLAMCRPGTMIFEMHDVYVTAGDDVAFATALTRCGGTGENGEAMTGWLRMTAGYRKLHGTWMIVYEHFLAPFDMETLMVLGVQP
jgi:ketosteroid isomerase-like protein